MPISVNSPRRTTVQLRTPNRCRSPIARRHRKAQHLLHALARNPEMKRRRTLAHPVPASETNLPIKFHGMHAPALPVGDGFYTTCRKGSGRSPRLFNRLQCRSASIPRAEQQSSGRLNRCRSPIARRHRKAQHLLHALAREGPICSTVCMPPPSPSPGRAEFCTARSETIPPLPWTNFPPPFSMLLVLRSSTS